jgi:hypothetical protein
MRHLRTAAVAAALLAPLAGAPAHAATCPLLTDAAGDVALAEYDLRSADVASGATTVVAVIRVGAIETGPQALAPALWALHWRINTTHYSAWVRRDAGTGTYAPFFAAKPGTSAHGVTVAVDPTAASFTITVPRTALPDLATPGQTFADVDASTSLTTVGGTDFDTAVTSQTYVDGTAGCVPAA